MSVPDIDKQAAEFMDELKRKASRTGNRPDLVPAIGVNIECRIVVRRPRDWEYVQDTLNHCREHGEAQLTAFKTLGAE